MFLQLNEAILLHVTFVHLQTTIHSTTIQQEATPQRGNDGYCHIGDKDCSQIEELKTAGLRYPFPEKSFEDSWGIFIEDREFAVTKYAQNPPIYCKIFDNFLNTSECDRIIEISEEQGLEGGTTNNHRYIGSSVYLTDTDKDGMLSLEEMEKTLQNNLDVYFSDQDLLKMYADLNVHADKDGTISSNELYSKLPSPKTLVDYVQTLAKKRPSVKGRDSALTWIFPDKSRDRIVQAITDRVAHVLNLPRSMINKSDIQVVHYKTAGHYNLHIDTSALVKSDITSEESLPCCHRFNGPRQCRSCRWATILFYLNDVPHGGETVFPYADCQNINTTQPFDYQTMKQKCNAPSNLVNLHSHCPDNLRVKPKKGTAVLWFNHHQAEDGQWIGEQNHFSEHGSCPTISCEKWAANFWIKFTDDRNWDMTPTHRKS